MNLLEGHEYVWRGRSGRPDLVVEFTGRYTPAGLAVVTLIHRADRSQRYINPRDLFPTDKPLPPLAPQTMLVETLLSEYRDGDEHGWPTEFAWLIEHHTKKVLNLLGEVREEGIRDPILLGPDKRVWDGHHRLLVARILGIRRVPVSHPEGEET